MAQVDVVGGIAAGADLDLSGASFKSGQTAAGWALRWFLIATAFLLIISFAGSRRG